ncbi:acyl-CoA thioester hydrolase/BAAT C-terminal domain-containing protein [Cytophagaceae bacterium DM2B3-1]|uniref:Acyl-CoA thioester hydrolase/BAAT C-terminal domain-containing protein n=1 Tax=Xanthocytophaga flava TaxID=3048013 RepID=A0ABT7CRW9_9BACT|nr:acyl-CoA thioester hydrolase/BAAT C-terminal domain-containing protein [Xanthocytophaga flavus]MDJ1496487.1 acyl-CoA thioester hydrolase/BAAT C-terminal domain-containing protein [Xanthocytophaga flavus]
MKVFSSSLVICLLILLLSCQSSQQRVSYFSGFKTIQITDSSRLYKSDSPQTYYLHYRPIDIDMWYPADSSPTDSVLVFGNMLSLFEQRANFYTDSHAGDGFSTQLAKSFTDFFHCSSVEKILASPTQSRKDTKAAAGKFPLVLYMASYNGMGYENIQLLENLAKNGYIVASFNSIGRYPGDMTMQQADLMEQVSDAAFGLKYLKKLPEVDSSRIAVVGYSWGGLAGVVLGMTHTDIDAVISLDGSEFHHYGLDAKEDSLFNQISHDFVSNKTPYLRLESSSTEDQATIDSVYNFNTVLQGPKQIYKILNTSHGDFSVYPTIVKQSGGCPAEKSYKIITQLVTGYCSQILKQTPPNAFTDTIRKEEGRTLKTILTNYHTP